MSQSDLVPDTEPKTEACTPSRPRDYPNTKSHQTENGRATVLGVICITFLMCIFWWVFWCILILKCLASLRRDVLD